MTSQTRNVDENFAQDLNLPDNAIVHATTIKKSPRLFETKIEVSAWRSSLFCRAIGQTPAVSLQMAKRKIARLISDLHERRIDKLKHSKPQFDQSNFEQTFEKRVLNDSGAF